MTLKEAVIGQEYTVKSVNTNDEDMVSFLLTLGCYEGAPITVVQDLKTGYIVSIKDGRYSIDNSLAEAILV